MSSNGRRRSSVPNFKRTHYPCSHECHAEEPDYCLLDEQFAVVICVCWSQTGADCARLRLALPVRPPPHPANFATLALPPPASWL
jgi:hypothetical protein